MIFACHTTIRTRFDIAPVEEIVCTPEHPFYSPVKGWTAACRLRAGDILVTVNGEYVVLEKIQHELLESLETTYNFEVSEFHTYYVGDTEVLVHNVCSTQKHHIMTNKNKKYTPQFEEIAKKYELNLNSYDNIRTVSNHITYLVNNGWSAPVISARVGHESIYITTHYMHCYSEMDDAMCEMMDKDMK